MANQIENIYAKQAEDQLKKVLDGLTSIHKKQMELNNNAIEFYGGRTGSNPNELNAVISNYDELSKKYADLEAKLKRLNEQRQRSVARTSEEIVNQRALAQASDRQARSTSALVGAMANLNAKHQQAKITLQNLIASQTASNAQIKQAQREYDLLDKRVVKANNAVREFNYNVGNYPKQAISGIRNLIGAFGIVGGVSLFATIAQDIFKTTKELQGLDNALKQVSGTQEAYSINQEFLKKTSEDFGLEIKGLTQQFTQFYVSAKDELSRNEIEQIFTSIAKAGATMGISLDAQNRAFTAINQSMAKGQVMSEELKGQLAEALPGALGIMAKSLNVTKEELMKMMEAGEVSSKAWVGFAETLEKVYGIETINRTETLIASTNRLSNTWTEFIRSLNESETGGISRFFKFMVDGLNSIFRLLIEANKNFKQIQKEVGLSFYENEKKQVFEFAKMSADIGKKRFKTEKEYLDRIRELEVKDAKDRLFRAENALQELKLKQEDVAFTLNVEQQESKSLLTGGIFNLSDLKKAKKAFEENSLAISNTQQRILALKDIIKGDTQIQEENTKSINDNTKKISLNTKKFEDNTKAKEDARLALVGSVEWFEILKSALEKEQKQLSTNNPKWEEYRLKIEQVQKSIDAITKASKELKEEEIELPGLKDSQFVKDLEKAKELLNFNEDFQKGFIDDFVSNSGFDKVFELIENFDKLKVDAVSTALAISEAFQQAFNTISTMSDANYQQMYANLERQRDTSILFAGESATARAEIERVYEERRKRIQRQQAESQKRLAMFNIATNTAQAVMAVFAKTPPPVGIPLAVLVGAIGAAQLALTASQPIPQFAIGTQNAPEGLAWTDERGAELHTDKSGKIKDLGSSKGARLKKLEKGDKIYTASQTKKILDLYSFNKEYDNIMLTNGIAPAPEIGKTIVDLEPLRNELISLKSIIANKSEFTMVNNESGTRYYERVNGQRRELINSVLTMKSRSVR
jgi:tape measure domain-containing protein